MVQSDLVADRVCIDINQGTHNPVDNIYEDIPENDLLGLSLVF